MLLLAVHQWLKEHPLLYTGNVYYLIQEEAKLYASVLPKPSGGKKKAPSNKQWNMPT
jgi:hypothetical protein